MFGSNVASVVVADHGCAPYTVKLDNAGKPVLGDGANGTLAFALPPNDDLFGVRIVEAVKNDILDLFKNGKLPKNAILTDKGISYTEMLISRSTILSDSMLDGWTIVSVTPQEGNGWKAGFDKGTLEIKFTDEAYYQVVTVTLQKTGTSETKNIEIEFSGEKGDIWERIFNRVGCNTGAVMLSLLALCPIFIIRRRVK
jgi:hypothetical protein